MLGACIPTDVFDDLEDLDVSTTRQPCGMSRVCISTISEVRDDLTLDSLEFANVDLDETGGVDGYSGSPKSIDFVLSDAMIWKMIWLIDCRDQIHSTIMTALVIEKGSQTLH